MRILVLVLGARAAPYPFLTRVIRKTWASVDVPGTEVLFYRGGDKARAGLRCVDLPVPDDLPNVGRKTLACFEHVLERLPFDVLFRTNCSSYVDLRNLRSYAAAHARPERFYAGGVSMHEGVPFASGSGYFLSRDLVELVVAQQASWDHGVLDDVALGALLVANGIRLEPAPRRDYGSRGEVRDVDTSQFHFRCRTDSWRRLGDARIMVTLHRAFCEARGERVALDLRAFTALEHLGRRGRSLVAGVL